MAFNFFGFKKKQDIEDVAVKVPTPTVPSPMSGEKESEPPEQFAETSIQETFNEATERAENKIEALPLNDSTVDQIKVPENETLPPKVLSQMETLKSTREDVIAAYKIFLGRLPESMEVVDPRVGVSPSAILVDFLVSKEFLDQAPKSQLILGLAKKILDERKQNAVAEEPASGSTSN